MKKLFLPAILLLSAVGWAQAPAPAKKPTQLQSELTKLKAAYGKAIEAYYAPYAKAKTEEESAKIKLDPAKSPDKLFLPKFRAFAKRAGKNDVAAQAWMQIYQMGMAIPKVQFEAFNMLVTNFPDSTVMPELVNMVSYSFYDLGDKRTAKVNEMLGRIEKATKSDSVKASVLYTKAKMIAEDGRGDTKAAKAMLDKLMQTYPNSTPAKSAKADIFELENLSVGCTAPDFEAEDENGVKFKLSDYRGKVVVLDFWGFW